MKCRPRPTEAESKGKDLSLLVRVVGGSVREWVRVVLLIIKGIGLGGVDPGFQGAFYVMSPMLDCQILDCPSVTMTIRNLAFTSHWNLTHGSPRGHHCKNISIGPLSQGQVLTNGCFHIDKGILD